VPDPAGLAAVDITNPQTWNRYAYVANNPLNTVDPLGLYLCDPYNYDDSSEPCNSDGTVFGGWGGGSVAGGSGGYGCGDPSYRGAHPIGCGLTGGPGNPLPPGVGLGGGSLGIPDGLATGSWGILPAFLPTGLPCPQGLSFLCGGIDPAMDVEPTASPSCVGVFFTQSAANFFGIDAQDVTDLVHRLITMSPGYMANIAVPASKAARGGLSWSQYFSKAYASKLALAEKVGTGIFVGQAIWAQIQGLWAEYQAAKAGNCE
ncbi:MAG: hypothetical protein WA655_22285, partial [Candidatus Korobacteraceae bacterium]